MPRLRRASTAAKAASPDQGAPTEAGKFGARERGKRHRGQREAGATRAPSTRGPTAIRRPSPASRTVASSNRGEIAACISATRPESAVGDSPVRSICARRGRAPPPRRRHPRHGPAVARTTARHPAGSQARPAAGRPSATGVPNPAAPSMNRPKNHAIRIACNPAGPRSGRSARRGCGRARLCATGIRRAPAAGQHDPEDRRGRGVSARPPRRSASPSRRRASRTTRAPPPAPQQAPAHRPAPPRDGQAPSRRGTIAQRQGRGQRGHVRTARRAALRPSGGQRRVVRRFETRFQTSGRRGCATTARHAGSAARIPSSSLKIEGRAAGLSLGSPRPCATSSCTQERRKRLGCSVTDDGDGRDIDRPPPGLREGIDGAKGRPGHRLDLGDGLGAVRLGTSRRTRSPAEVCASRSR